MRYHVTIGGRNFEVDLAADPPTVDGQSIPAELARVPGTPIHHLLADGRSYELAASPGEAKGHWVLHMNGYRFAAEVVDERTRAIRALTGAGRAAQGPKPIRAPMPGLIVRVEVEPGQAVAAGQGVVIIEAMKMENELKAAADAVVSRVLVEQGQAVEKGAVLVEFES